MWASAMGIFHRYDETWDAGNLAWGWVRGWKDEASCVLGRAKNGEMNVMISGFKPQRDRHCFNLAPIQEEFTV